MNSGEITAELIELVANGEEIEKIANILKYHELDLNAIFFPDGNSILNVAVAKKRKKLIKLLILTMFRKELCFKVPLGEHY